MTNQPETELERSAREVVRAWFDGLRGPVMAQYINNLDAALRNQTSAFQVCAYSHDHPRGDPSYDDCMVAYEDAKARMAEHAGLRPTARQAERGEADPDLFHPGDDLATLPNVHLRDRRPLLPDPSEGVKTGQQRSITAGRRYGKTLDAIGALPKLQQGQRYRIVYRSDTQRTDHYSVLDALSETDSYYVLNARPVAGTQEMPKRWVKSVTQVPRETKIVIGKIVRPSAGERRAMGHTAG